jgi:nucleoside-diphosphate-sugar epimerase
MWNVPTGIFFLLAALARGADVCCVAGAAGFVGSELVKQLLERGFRVRGTVRDLENKGAHKHLLRLAAGLAGSLELFEADLRTPGSFDACASGAKYFFHVAALVDFAPTDARSELVEPAVEGVKHIVQSCLKGDVQRIVHTGSVGRVYSLTKGDVPLNGKLWTEADHNRRSEALCQTTPNGTIDGVPHGYMASKVLSERALTRLCTEHAIELVVILPSGIIGPLYSTRSVQNAVLALFWKPALEGRGSVGLDTPFCDNRDVAKAHITAALKPQASGRYLVSHPGMVPKAYLSETLDAAFPMLAVPGGPREITPLIGSAKSCCSSPPAHHRHGQNGR